MQRPFLSIRGVLFGFASLLLLMAIVALDSAIQTRSLGKASAALRKESRSLDALMDQLRSDVFRSSTLLRDYVLEQDETRSQDMKVELYQVRSRIVRTLQRYRQIAPARENDSLTELQLRSESFWRLSEPALHWDHKQARQHGEAFLRSKIIPSRDEVVQLTRQIATLNERMLDAGEEQIEAIQLQFQRRVALLSTAGLLLGAILAVVVLRHTRRLSRQMESSFNEVVAAREDLRRLSDKLLIVQEEERRALSRELHDELGQTMSAMLIEVGKLESAARKDHWRFVDRITAVRHMAEEDVRKVRNMALLLRPAMLDELGLIPALRWHAKEVTRRTGVKVKLIAGDFHEDIPEENRTCVYRIVQEAVNNCVKHARAQEVRVMVHREDRGLSISVQDDGCGFDPTTNKGLGLLGMSERIALVGGRLHLESKPGEGTLLSAFVPLPPDVAEPGRTPQHRTNSERKPLKEKEPIA